MRHINTSGYNPKGWTSIAQKKTVEITACPTNIARKAYLDIAANQVWVQHKIAFERMSHNKCWFSEAYATVSDFQLEHFRPKKKVDLIKSKDDYSEKRKVADYNGYWWLAYELDNFRLAGGKPNQKKGNYFPLETNSILAREKDNSWRKENFMLLDPCNKSDVQLLSYSGVEPIETNPDINSHEHIRARISIKVYGLKLQKLKNARSRVFEAAKNYYENCKLNWDAMNQYNNINQEAYDLAKQNFDLNCSNLILMLRPNREFTKMVLDFLIGLNRLWIKQYILDIAESIGYIK
jgi:hypothetical protein